MQVPHRVVIATDGTVRHNLDGLQGLGVLPSRMPSLLRDLSADSAPKSGGTSEAAEERTRALASARALVHERRLSRERALELELDLARTIPLAAQVRAECFADDLPLLESMRGWSEEQLREHFMCGGTIRP